MSLFDSNGSSARLFRFCPLRLAQVHVSFVLSLLLRWSRARPQKASMATSLVRAPGEGAGSSDRWPHTTEDYEEHEDAYRRRANMDL